MEFRVADRGESPWRHLHAKGGDGKSGVIVLEDKTAIRQAENQRTEMIERISEASQLEALGTLAGGIAHEINNPAQFIGDNLNFIGEAIVGLSEVALAAELAAKGDGNWQAVIDAALQNSGRASGQGNTQRHQTGIGWNRAHRKYRSGHPRILLPKFENTHADQSQSPDRDRHDGDAE